MKVTVRKTGYDEYEIRLSSDTKDKLRRAAWVTYYGGVASFVAYRYYQYKTAQ